MKSDKVMGVVAQLLIAAFSAMCYNEDNFTAFVGKEWEFKSGIDNMVEGSHWRFGCRIREVGDGVSVTHRSGGCFVVTGVSISALVC